MEELNGALARFRLAAEEFSTRGDINDILEERKPRNVHLRAKTRQEVEKHVEKEFLAAPTEFGTQWLNQLQQRWDVPLNYAELFQLAPTQTRTVIRFTREGLEGRVTGYKEVTVPASSANSKNSTSILRKPANRANFVRGGSGQFPFAPGGLEGVEAIAKEEDEMIRARDGVGSKKRTAGLAKIINMGQEGGLLDNPPGFERGLRLDVKSSEPDKKAENEVDQILDEEPADSKADDEVDLPNGHAMKPTPKDEDQPADEPQDDAELDIDALLPVEFAALAPRGTLLSAKQKRGKEWAHMVDVNRPIPNFRELVPDMARTWPFELDTFQKEAVYHLENNDSVFVAAHTSAGKTVVAEYAIALAAKHMTKAIYTSPIKALSNQKFRDFRTTFDDVGILTGDVQIKPEASCLIMTTEILRSMLYRGADLIRDVEYVIFDEVHYVNDLERGVVWEEVIIMLPEYVTLILLSATVPNTFEFASWVGRTKKKNIYVISTPKRPVPLQHYLWSGKSMHLVVDADKKFQEKGWKEANDVLSGRDKVKAQAQATKDQASARGGAGGARGGQTQRGGANQRGQPRGGRGQPSQQARGNIARTGRGSTRTTAAQDRTLWVSLVNHLRQSDLLPACIFVFSKKRCEENADALANLDFSSAAEKSGTHMVLEKSLARLRHEDRALPQIRRMRDLLGRGVAVHHGGLLPIVKEVVELLFARGLVKVLFATETFAMGLNLPTRTVVFSGYRKHDGRAFRDLLPGEYTQMAGRAGRRGLDPVGTVIIVAPGADEAPPAATLRQMVLGDPTKLRSQFRLTYNMILNLLRVEALKIEEMIKRSFSENAAQALLPEHERAVQLGEADLAKIQREPCEICDADLEQVHRAGQEYEVLTQELHIALLGSPVGKRLFSPRRLVVFRKDNIRTAGVLLREGALRNTGAVPSVSVLSIAPHTQKQHASDLLPQLPAYRRFFPALPDSRSALSLKVLTIPVTDVLVLASTQLKSPLSETAAASLTTDAASSAALDELIALATSWDAPTWDETDYSRLRDLSIRELLSARAAPAVAAQSGACLSCPAFARHYDQQHSLAQLHAHLAHLRSLLSDQNLQMLPDYNQRLAVLRELGFVDDAHRVQLKGKVACEIHSGDELVLTELLLENGLAPYAPAEIAALLSCFVFAERTDTEPRLTPGLARGAEAIVEIADRVNGVQEAHQVIQATTESNDFLARPRFGLVEVVYEWARGMPFARVMELTDVLEGTIVRVIGRLDEVLREVRGAARVVGDPDLVDKVEKAREGVRRDIVGVGSLYM